jgi:hypothetical protein
VLTVPLAASAGLVAAAFLVAACRDHSAGLLPDRPGRGTASSLLRGPFGLAWRLQWPVLAAWLAAFVFAFAAFGAGANGFGSIIGGSAVLRRYLLTAGYQATITDAYLSALTLIARLAVAAYSTSVILRLRTEETANLAEPVLSTATGRIRWALSHISVAVGGACLLLTAAGLSAGLGYGVITGSVRSQLPKNARRCRSPTARGNRAAGGGRLAVRTAAVGIHRAGVDRGGAGSGHHRVRPTAPPARSARSATGSSPTRATSQAPGIDQLTQSERGNPGSRPRRWCAGPAQGRRRATGGRWRPTRAARPHSRAECGR